VDCIPAEATSAARARGCRSSAAQQIVPLDTAGRLNYFGRIVLLSIGMSNTFSEFHGFSLLARSDISFNRRVALVNGRSLAWLPPNG